MSLVIVGSLAFDTIETPDGAPREDRRRLRDLLRPGRELLHEAPRRRRRRPRFPEEDPGLPAVAEDRPQGRRGEAGKTFHWEGRYGQDPNQRTTVRTDLNVFADFKPCLPPSYRSADILYLANIDPDLHGPVLAQAKKPRLVAMDTIRYWIETKPDAVVRELGRVDVYFANDEEVKLLAGDANLVRAGKKLLKYGPSLVVAKKGEHGALVFGRDFVFGVLARPCDEVVDPTGAGDSFAGGFLGHLDRVPRATGRELRRAAVYGSIIASFVIEDFGVDRFLTLRPEEIDARYREFRKLVSF